MLTGPLFFFAPNKGDEGVQASALDSAPSFFSEQDFGVREQLLERNGKYTGDRFFSQRQADYAEVVRLLADGMSVRKVAERVGVSVNTVQAVRRREGVAVDTMRGKTVAALSEFVADSAERLRDEGHEIDIEKLAVPLGIATEKLLLLTGGATQRVELVTESPAEEWERYVATLPTAGMGLSGEEIPQIDGADHGSGGSIDTQSTVHAHSTGLDGGHATHSARTGETSTGGEGVEICPPPPSLPIHSPSAEPRTKDTL